MLGGHVGERGGVQHAVSTKPVLRIQNVSSPGKRPRVSGAGSRLACLTMVFKLAMAAQKQWRALSGSQLIADVIDGVPFVDGLRKGFLTQMYARFWNDLADHASASR